MVTGQGLTVPASRVGNKTEGVKRGGPEDPAGSSTGSDGAGRPPSVGVRVCVRGELALHALAHGVLQGGELAPGTHPHGLDDAVPAGRGVVGGRPAPVVPSPPRLPAPSQPARTLTAASGLDA